LSELKRIIMEAWKREIEELAGTELKEYPPAIRFPFKIDPEQLALE
jgi:hypothetical protein